MPVYEFLCGICNRIYSFHSFRADSEKVPSCPRCGETGLERVPSSFGIGSSRQVQAGGGGAGEGSLDDPRVEREMMRLMSDLEGMDEESPQAMAGAVRRMAEISGEPITPTMEEMIRRLEAGEDPDRLEEEMGDALEEEMGLDSSGPDTGHGAAPPVRDGGLYPM